ncbi:hypothetical protein B0T26DRAFT_678710 [Lasiosphaeria miniovina]|uniref:Transmembrane protein n=1 Tax=Lasiosphaeria miniovina TaxID=1954250 RepID=A0AA40DML7_9PEZI|nr:uncharacterized protein B0T26DRAFT_678710 [Lasiosphaeria miniovina]KAK0709264.1 hypothetical protein B0T26DRAFT_678710 [Lasiosphaeria miniovina]
MVTILPPPPPSPPPPQLSDVHLCPRKSHTFPLATDVDRDGAVDVNGQHFKLAPYPLHASFAGRTAMSTKKGPGEEPWRSKERVCGWLVYILYLITTAVGCVGCCLVCKRPERKKSAQQTVERLRVRQVQLVPKVQRRAEPQPQGYYVPEPNRASQEKPRPVYARK